MPQNGQYFGSSATSELGTQKKFWHVRHSQALTKMVVPSCACQAIRNGDLSFSCSLIYSISVPLGTRDALPRESP